MKMQKITSDPSYSLQNGARVMFLIFLNFKTQNPLLSSSNSQKPLLKLFHLWRSFRANNCRSSLWFYVV